MPIWTGAADNNWSNINNWAIDGLGNTGVPTATTDAIFTNTSSVACTVTANATCRNLSFNTGSGYAGTITFSNNLTVRGNIDLSTTTTYLGANGIIINNVGNVTCNANSAFFDRPLLTNQNGSGGNTISIGGTWRVSSFTLTAIGGNPFTFSGGTIEVTGNMSLGQPMTGSSTTFRMTGSGTLSVSGAGTFVGTMNFDSGANTLTITNLIMSGTLNWISGNINHTGLLTISGNTSLNLQNVQFNNYQQNFNTTCTLVSDANFNNVTIGSSGGTGVIVNGVGFRLRCRGNFTFSQTGANATGTSTITLTGSGNINFTVTNSVNIAFEINTTGSYTFTSNTSFGTSFTRINGSVNAGLFTVTFFPGIVLDTSGINWYNVVLPGTGLAQNYQLNSLLTVTNNLTLAATGNVTFTGTAGWTCANLICSTPSRTITLQNSIQYTTTTNANFLGGELTRITMTSNSPSLRAIWTLNDGATQSMVYVNGTRIDSSQGQTIWTFGGVRNDTINWNIGTRPDTTAWTFLF